MRIVNKWRRRLSDALPGAQKRRDGESGQALVEFVLVSPVLVAILLAIVQFGIMLSEYITVTDSARIGAQQLALGSGLTDPCDQAVTDANNAGSSINLVNTGSVTPSFATSTDFCGAATSTSTSGCPYVYKTSCNTNGNEASGDEATITVQKTYKLNILGFHITSVNLSATASDAIQ
jgi:Flp pilus assembly protein TadG